jgi:hypothetical protein
MNNRSCSGAPYVSRTVCESPAFEVGGQTIRKTGRAETLIMPRRCSNVSRVPSESRIYTWTGNRYFGSSKTSPAIGSLLLPPHSPVRVTSCLCAYHRGQARDTQYLEQQMPVFGALRPAEVVFRSLRYTHRAQQISEPWRLSPSLDGLDTQLEERERAAL